MNPSNLDPESEQSNSNDPGKDGLTRAEFAALSSEARLERMNDIISRDDIDSFLANISMFSEERYRNRAIEGPFGDYSRRVLDVLARHQPERLKSLLLESDREVSLILLEPLLVEELTGEQVAVLAEIYDQLAPRLALEDRGSLDIALCLSRCISWMELHPVEVNEMITHICEMDSEAANNFFESILKIEELANYPKTSAIIASEFQNLSRSDRESLLIECLWRRHVDSSALRIFDNIELIGCSPLDFVRSVRSLGAKYLSEISGNVNDSSKEPTEAMVFDAILAGTQNILNSFEVSPPSQIAIQVALLGSWHCGTAKEGTHALYQAIQESSYIDEKKRNALSSFLAITAIEITYEDLRDQRYLSRNHLQEPIERILRPMNNLGANVVKKLVDILGKQSATEVVQKYRSSFSEEHF